MCLPRLWGWVNLKQFGQAVGYFYANFVLIWRFAVGLMGKGLLLLAAMTKSFAKRDLQELFR